MNKREAVKMTEKLLPCPFCGGEALMRERYINGIANTKHYRRECHHCKATFAHWFRSVKKADAAWNRRADHLPDATKMVSNADRIRGMSDEELAVFLDTNTNDCDFCICLNKDICDGFSNDCTTNFLTWLKRPVKEEHHEDD
jgi:Lar family restriction alleviation protein